ncbi:MAG: glycosyltransferase [Gammaproteobacteria bacterium]|nr:glycosyltransferase [Gammaproteobacteria bacterium]
MRICQVLAAAEDGGVENHVYALSNALAERGDDVALIAHLKHATSMRNNVAFHAVDLTRSRRNPLARRDLKRAIAAARPDVVHAHAGKAAALVAALALPCPTVGTVHGTKRDLSAYERFTQVIGVSQGVIEPLDHPAKAVVYHGVAAPDAGADACRTVIAQELGIDPSRPFSLAVGRLVPVKAFHRLIEFWHEDLGSLVIVGEGPERRRLQRLAAGRPVVMAGFRPDVRNLMQAADLLVISSTREAFHLGMAEALRERLPVVSTRVCGPEEILPPEQLADAGSLEATIRRSLLDLDATRGRMAPVFDWAERTLTVERMVEETRRVYAEALAA